MRKGIHLVRIGERICLGCSIYGCFSNWLEGLKKEAWFKIHSGKFVSIVDTKSFSLIVRHQRSASRS